MLDIQSFQNAATTDFSRTIIDQQTQTQALKQDSGSSFFQKLSQNNALHNAFKSALSQQFGSNVASQAMKGTFRFGSFSSQKISKIMNRAVIANGKQLASRLQPTGIKDPVVSATVSEGLRMIGNKNCQTAVFNVEDRFNRGEIHPPDPEHGKPGTTIGGFEFIELKQKGVEPGFVGKLEWTDAHTQALTTNDTPMNKLAMGFIGEQLSLISQPMEPATVGIKQSALEFLKKETGNHALTPDDVSPMLRDKPELASRVKEHVLGDKSCGEYIRRDVRAHTPALNQKHYIKLDYAESDKFKLSSRMVQIPKRSAKGSLHRFFTAKTKQAANRNAMKEVMASDLMRSMGIETQQAHLLRAKYQDGSVKLLIEAPHMQMVSEGEGVQNFSDFSGRLVDGFLVESQEDLGTPSQAIAKRDQFASDTSITALGRNKIFMLALADRDAIGSRGDNKGRIGNTFAAIDPGHSLEGLMGFRNINSDFSFENGTFAKFKNFSIFDDSSYSEKFMGVTQLQTMRDNGSDLAVFDNYDAWIDSEIKSLQGDSNNESQINDFQSMKAELGKMKEAWTERRDYILDTVFGERLQVANDKPAVIESLDCLEKLTAKARITSPSGKVHLHHLQTSGKRAEWHVTRDLAGTGYLLHADTGKQGMEKLQRFFSNSHTAFEPKMEMDGKRLMLHVPQSEIETFTGLMQEGNILDHKIEIGEIAENDADLARQMEIPGEDPVK
ncbi:MAG: hypothetical protein JEZ12_27665 [Desulfobacterium sp.]|nr:hypothetical protein [Desulfobacterium sp.]